MRVKISDMQSGYYDREGEVVSNINDEFRTLLFVQFEGVPYKCWFDISQIQFVEEKEVDDNDGENIDSNTNVEAESSELPNS